MRGAMPMQMSVSMSMSMSMQEQGAGELIPVAGASVRVCGFAVFGPRAFVLRYFGLEAGHVDSLAAASGGV